MTITATPKSAGPRVLRRLSQRYEQYTQIGVTLVLLIIMLVVGNLLETRKTEVVFVAPGRPAEWIRLPAPAAEQELHRQRERRSSVAGAKGDQSAGSLDEPEVEIEGMIVPAVIRLHGEYRDKRAKV